MRYDARGLPVYPWMRGDTLGADELNAAFSGHILRSGDTMGGELILAQDPVIPMDAVTKQYVDARVGTATIVFADTPPNNPVPGMLWWDTVGLQLYLWYHDPTSSQWVPTNSTSPVGVVAASVPPSATPPASPVPGSLWWDNVSGQLFIYYDDGNSHQWVVANNAYGVTQTEGDARYLQLTGGTMTGELQVNLPVAGQAANFFRYGYGATGPLVNIQNAGDDLNTTDFRALVVQGAITQDNDTQVGAQGVLYASAQVIGKAHIDIYAIHALTYVSNARADGADPSQSQHGGIACQTVKTLPSGGYPTGKIGPDVFTQWWQNVNQTNQGSAIAGADIMLEADTVGNGPDDIWKIASTAVTGNTTAGNATITGMSSTSAFVVGQTIMVAQTGDTYIQCRVASLTTTTLTMDTPAVNTLNGVIVSPGQGIRMSFQNTILMSTTVPNGGKHFEWMFGHYQNGSFGGDGIGAFGIGFAFYAPYYVAGADFSQGVGAFASPFSADGINRAVAIKLRAGQKIAFDGDGYRGTWLTGVSGGGLQLVKDTTVVASFGPAGRLTTPQVIINPNGPTVGGGVGAPTGVQPAGSIWMRSDGAIGTNLYVSAGAGTWNAVAGV